MIRSGLLAGVVAASFLAGRAEAATGMPASVLRCRRVVAKEFAQFIDTDLRILASCHAAHRQSRDCNVLAGVPAYERARERAKGATNAFCLGGDPVLLNYPLVGNDPVNPVAPVMRRRIEDNGQALQAVSNLGGDRHARRCTRAIGRARQSIIARMLHGAIHCQNALDVGAATLGPIAADCVGDGSNVSVRWRARITKACAGVASATVGTCDSVPDCAITSIIAAGQDLEHDVYGGSVGELCRNGELDAGEQCDDGNQNDNDTCTNACKNATCGDGIVETGVEQCDDGNNDETDACTPRCELARCGDGIVETGVEECDDGAANGTPGDLCQADCTYPQIACSPSGRVDLTATLDPKKDHSTYTDPKGITLTIAYPSGASIPGMGNISVDDPTDPAAHVLLLDPDLYNGVLIYNDSDTVLKVAVATTSPFSLADELPFERVSFDCTQGALFDVGQFQCSVFDEADSLGAVVMPPARPDCRLVLTAAP